MEVYGQRVALPSAERKGLCRTQEWKHSVVEKGARIKENEAKLETVLIRQNKALVEDEISVFPQNLRSVQDCGRGQSQNHDLPFLQLGALS